MSSPDSIIVACPGCQGKFKVAASYAGRTTPCPRCQHPIEINASFGETAAGPPPALPPPAEPPSRPIARRPAIVDDDDFDDVRRDDRYDDDDDDRYDDDDDRPRRRRRRGRRLEPHRGTTVLVLGIVSLVSFAVCAFIPMIIGPIAWIMGNQDLRQMREGRMDSEGQQSTQIGRVLGIVATSLSLVMLALCGFFIVLSIAMDRKGR